MNRHILVLVAAFASLSLVACNGTGSSDGGSTDLDGSVSSDGGDEGVDGGTSDDGGSTQNGSDGGADAGSDAGTSGNDGGFGGTLSGPDNYYVGISNIATSNITNSAFDAG